MTNLKLKTDDELIVGPSEVLPGHESPEALNAAGKSYRVIIVDEHEKTIKVEGVS